MSENKNHTNNLLSLQDLYPIVKFWVIYLKSKWYILLIVGFMGGGAGYFYAKGQKKLYVATLSFAMEDANSGGSSGLSGLASQFGFDVGGTAGSAFSGANLIELMKSRSLIEKALLKPITVNDKQKTLVEFYLDFSKMRTENWLQVPGLEKIFFSPGDIRSMYTLQQDSVLAVVYQDIITSKLSVSQKDKKVSIIYIDVKSENELFSKAFAQTLADVVSTFYIETKSKKAHTTVSILERQTDSIRAELNSALEGVATASDNVFNLNPALNIKRVPTTRRQIDVQANTAMLTQLVQNLEIAKMTLRKETPLIQIIDEPILPLKIIKPSKLTTAIKGSLLLGMLAVFLLIGIKWVKDKELVSD